MLSAEERTREHEKLICRECGEAILAGEEHTVMEVFDSPWGPPARIAVHADKADNPWETCESRLTDTEWAESRYFDCDCCGRRVIRRCPDDIRVSYARELRGREICLRCFRIIQVIDGVPEDTFREGRVEGAYFPNGELTAYGYETVPGFFGYRLDTDGAARRYCGAALRLIERGYVIVNEYELMATDGSDGFVTMWRRKEGRGHEKRQA